ncbi:MAG: TVP38/TMEM64 family protein [Gemmatimonadales bacterium]|nr:MAG: TVP38/TMEM64 family protein [Gemmatimonadales bacterium]
MALSLIPTLVLVGLLVLALVVNGELRASFLEAWSLLTDGDTEGLRNWMLAFGVWAPVVSALLQLATSIFPPGPSFLLGIANAMVFGLWWGGLLTLGTQLVAAAACFGIARLVGRPGVERLVSEERLARVDTFMRRRGVLAIFVGRIIPFINPDLVSYAAGVTGIRWPHFLLAVTAGAIPSTIFYTVVGGTAVEASGRVIVLVALASTIPLVLLVVFRRPINEWLKRFERSRS